ncbi:hypothetical protein GIB67_020010 [Kingdonia uniflora]|uniref:PORR domain-containing protein n=1 Tax=Kingdonia uniflora TaxID=39325 RepID=A0A7J7MIH0_9MAGN|nr:hypothetical protein GIB67_020010 [Kingdonia uniflora]
MFGLPNNFEYSTILKHPQYFRLFDAEEARNKYIEIAELEYEHDPKVLKDPNLIVCAIERLWEREYRERRVEAENIGFAFNVKFPPGFKINKYHKITVWVWQQLPYWSSYEDIFGYDLRSIEARKCLEKRGVAMIYELFSITVEKKLALERITHFRMAMDLPKEFLLQHQGGFYISARGNQGKLHTVFLRDTYWRGDLVEPNELNFARRKLAELIKMSSGKYMWRYLCFLVLGPGRSNDS